MPDLQETIALGIVALVAGLFAWRRLAPGARRRPAGGSGCDGCGPGASPPVEATVHFYRRRNDEGPARGPSQTAPGAAARQRSGADAPPEREGSGPDADQ